MFFVEEQWHKKEIFKICFVAKENNRRTISLLPKPMNSAT